MHLVTQCIPWWCRMDAGVRACGGPGWGEGWGVRCLPKGQEVRQSRQTFPSSPQPTRTRRKKNPLSKTPPSTPLCPGDDGSIEEREGRVGKGGKRSKCSPKTKLFLCKIWSREREEREGERERGRGREREKGFRFVTYGHDGDSIMIDWNLRFVQSGWGASKHLTAMWQDRKTEAASTAGGSTQKQMIKNRYEARKERKKKKSKEKKKYPIVGR